MTTTDNNTLLAVAELSAPVTVLQATEKTLTEAVTGFFDLADQQGAAIIAKYQGVVWQHLETGKGMQAAVDARAELRTFRTGIVDKAHKAFKEPLLAVGRIADARKTILGDSLKAAEKIVDDEIKAEEARKAAEKERLAKIERERIAGIRENIRGIAMMPSTLAGKTAAQMREILAELTNPLECPDEFQELAEEAALAYTNATDAIARLIADADAREAEQARLAAERAALAEEQRLAAEERQRQQAEFDRQSEELRQAREKLELEQQRARITARPNNDGATEPPAEMESDVADLISSRPADVQPIRAPQRPTDGQIVMVIADTYQVSESTAYEWLATFGSKSEAA